MLSRRPVLAVLALSVVGAAVTTAVVVADRPKPACACSIEPNLRGPAEDAASRFEDAVHRSDMAAAWALLTDGARSRYGDAAGFRPVLDRLGEALAEPGDWLTVDDRARYDRPGEVVVLRRTTAPARLSWPILVLVPLGRPGTERIDPEVPELALRATGERVELADGDIDRTTFVAVDAEGRESRPGREKDRLTWSIPPEGPVTIIALEKKSTGLRVGVATTTVT